MLPAGQSRTSEPEEETALTPRDVEEKKSQWVADMELQMYNDLLSDIAYEMIYVTLEKQAFNVRFLRCGIWAYQALTQQSMDKVITKLKTDMEEKGWTVQSALNFDRRSNMTEIRLTIGPKKNTTVIGPGPAPWLTEACTRPLSRSLASILNKGDGDRWGPVRLKIPTPDEFGHAINEERALVIAKRLKANLAAVNENIRRNPDAGTWTVPLTIEYTTYGRTNEEWVTRPLSDALTKAGWVVHGFTIESDEVFVPMGGRDTRHGLHVKFSAPSASASN